MNKNRRKNSLFITAIFVLILGLSTVYSCSTTTVVPDGQYRLRKNSIKMVGKVKEISKDDLMPYIRQKPNVGIVFGWNPPLYIYNWNNEKSNSGWNRLLRKIGQAPIIYDSSAVTSSKTNLKNRLQALGFYDSEVSDSVILKDKLASVTYYIKPGKSYIIKDILYSIRDTNIAKIVFSDTTRSVIKRGDRLAEVVLDEESNRLASILRNSGYYNFNKNYLFFEADTLSRDGMAELDEQIKNYTRNESAENAKPHEKYYIRNLTVYPAYNTLSSDNAATIIPDTLNYRGINFLYRDRLNIRPSVIASMNTIKPGDLYNESTVNNTYKRLVSLRYFSGVNIQFDEVSQSSRDNSSRKEVDCTIRLTPSRSQGFKINLEVSNNSNGLLGISPMISYYHKNIFRGGEWFNLSFLGNFQFTIRDKSNRATELGILTSLSLPKFLLFPDRWFKSSLPKTEIGASYNYQNRPEFTKHLISFNYGYSWSVNNFSFKLNPLQVNIVSLQNMDKEFYNKLKDPFLRSSYKNQFDIGLGTSAFYTSNPDMLPMVSSFYIRWVNDISGNLLSLFRNYMPTDSLGFRQIWNTPYSQYVRTDLTVVYTKWFNNWSSLANRINIGIGYAYGNSRGLPMQRLFYAGGSTSMRGWQARTLGPGSAPLDESFTIPNQSGDIKLELNSEYRFNIFGKIEGALFTDAGNIWTIRAERGGDNEAGKFRLKDFYKSIALDWGVGIRLNLSFLIIRLDLGIVAKDPRKESFNTPSEWFKKDGYSIQFGIGYPF